MEFESHRSMVVSCTESMNSSPNKDSSSLSSLSSSKRLSTVVSERLCTDGVAIHSSAACSEISGLRTNGLLVTRCSVISIADGAGILSGKDSSRHLDRRRCR